MEMAVLTDPQFEVSAATNAAVDPDWSEAWWWLGIPIAVAIAVMTIYGLWPAFYKAYIHPEGYGVLELSHFFMPLAGFIICVRLFFLPQVKAWPLLRAAIVLFALTCIFIAGEEMSWGQWIFHWNTPEYWADVNRQKETNLHNAYAIFNKVPRALLEIGIVIGGLILPLVAGVRNLLTPYPIMRILIPPLAIVPVAVFAEVTHLVQIAQKHQIIPRESRILPRPGEVLETYFYMFILFYLIILARRIRAMDQTQS